MRNLVVFGGSGFLGKRICQLASSKDYNVISLSRSGRSPLNESSKWTNNVQWESCDIFNPDTYKKYLVGASDVVHSIGILLEDQRYKMRINNSMSSQNSSCVQWFAFGKNPLEKKDPNFTYEKMNKYSAMLLADTFSSICKKRSSSSSESTFSYVSADRGFFMIPKDYIGSKRQAEEHIVKYNDVFRPICIRPGFMFDEAKHANDTRSTLKNMLDLANCGNRLLLGNNVQFVNDLIRPAVSTQQVSRALISKMEDPKYSGIVNLEDILST